MVGITPIVRAADKHPLWPCDHVAGILATFHPDVSLAECPVLATPAPPTIVHTRQTEEDPASPAYVTASASHGASLASLALVSASLYLLRAVWVETDINIKCDGENINKCCNREKKISNGQQQQSVIRVTPALCQWWIPQLRPGCPVNTTELPQSVWLPSPRPHCANFIYDEGVKLKWFYIKTYIDTYVVYSTFYLTIIIAIFVFRDANCKSSIKLSLLSLVDIFVSHYQISDRFGWSGV